MPTLTKTLKPCRHCGKHATRARRLCYGCYRDPAIADNYPTTSRHGSRGVADSYIKRPLPEPTDALPGSREKVRVLEERARQGFALFHPLDARIGDATDVPLREADECDADPLDLADEQLLNVVAVARLLGITTEALKSRLRSGSVPPPDERDGLDRRWRLTTVRAFLANLPAQLAE